MSTEILYEFLQFCVLLFFIWVFWDIAKSLRKISEKK